ncbi:MAG: PAS domain S-box protein [Ignavibacteriales bacterium]|nr:PAS domain S-box protein [Ignavibacteriales bacterium]
MINNPKNYDELLNELEAMKSENVNLKAGNLKKGLKDAGMEEDGELDDGKYRLLIESIKGGVFIVQDFLLQYVNSAIAKMTGYSVRELLGKDIRDLLAPEDVEMVAKNNSFRQAGNETPREYEFRLLHRDQVTRVYVKMSISLVEYKGRVASMGMLQDITVQKRAELEQNILYEIMQAVTTSTNLNELLNLIHRSLGKVIYAENCFVALKDQKTGLFSFPYFVDKFDPTPAPVSMHKSCTAYVYRTGAPLLLTQELFENLLERNEVELVGSNSPSWLGVSLRTAAKITGVLVLQHYENANVYSESDIQFLYSVGGQIALAIERKWAEDELRESEEFFRNLFVESADPILLLSAEGFTNCNASTVAILGYSTKEELLNKSPWELSPEKQPDGQLSSEKAQLMINQAIANGYNRFEWIHTKSDGSDLPVEVMLTPFQIQGKQYLYTIWRDITERKKAEAALQQSNQKLEAMLSATPDGIGVMGLDGKLLFVSDRLADMNRYPKDRKNELIGKHAAEFIDPGDHEKLYENINNLRSGAGENKLTEYLAVKADKSRFHIDINAAVLRDANGEPAGILFVERDITERKLIEAEINDTNLKLEKLNNEKDKLLSIIAHDLKSPFHGLLGLTEILANESAELSADEVSKFSRSVHNAVGNLYKLLENLLEWAQVQKGSIGFNPVELSLPEIFLQSKETVIERAKQKGISIRSGIPDGQKIFADEKMTTSVLRNLLSNAVKFTRKNGEVFVTAKNTGAGFIEISIKDSGVGIPVDAIEKLFKTDVKVSTKGTENEPSTGLGLLLCKEFIEKHGGKIWVESEKSDTITGKAGWSIFYFTLPAKNENKISD